MKCSDNDVPPWSECNKKRCMKRCVFGLNIDEEAMADATKWHRANHSCDDERDDITCYDINNGGDAPGAYIVQLDEETRERLEYGNLRNSIPAHCSTMPKDEPPTFWSVPHDSAAPGEDGGGNLKDVNFETGGATVGDALNENDAMMDANLND